MVGALEHSGSQSASAGAGTDRNHATTPTHVAVRPARASLRATTMAKTIRAPRAAAAAVVPADGPGGA